MKFQRIIFWAHLISGVAAGLVILFLSVTGVLLTYEHQIIHAFEQKSLDMENSTIRKADELINYAKKTTDNKVTGLVFERDQDKPVALMVGRRQHSLLNPYTGETIENADGVRGFFSTVTALHRWFALTGDGRDTGKMITGASNLIFLFLLISGIYIWLPRLWRWPILKTKIFFKKMPTSKARDYNWHHVLSFWSAIPLFFIIATALVFSYDWANKLVYSAYGEEVPTRRGPPATKSLDAAPVAAGETQLSIDTLLETARQQDNGWNRITLNVPSPSANSVTFKLDYGTGHQPQLVSDLDFDRVSGELIRTGGYSDRSPAQQARIYIRFLHTGETLGLIGQTIAGLASLAACFMVYTGLALAYRRFFK